MNITSKLKTGQFEVDAELNRITFTDQRWYKTDDGNYLPSVSSVLDAFPKPPQFYQWLKENDAEESDRIKNEAGESGSVVHNLSERYDLGEEVTLFDTDGVIRYKSIEWKMFELYVQWCKTYNPTILRTEFNIVSPPIGCGGTIDKLIELDGQRMLLDLKTSNQISDTYWMQLAAYKAMYEWQNPNDKIDNVCILWAKAKTRTEKYEKGKTYQINGMQLLFPPKPIEHYLKLFQHTQVLWNEVNGDMKPRNITYQLSHKK